MTISVKLNILWSDFQIKLTNVIFKTINTTEKETNKKITMKYFYISRNIIKHQSRVYIYIYIYIYVCVCVGVCVCLFVCVYICIYIFKKTTIGHIKIINTSIRLKSIDINQCSKKSTGLLQI